MLYELLYSHFPFALLLFQAWPWPTSPEDIIALTTKATWLCLQAPATSLGDEKAAATSIAQYVADWAVGRGALVESDAKAHLQLHISFRADSKSVPITDQLSWRVRIYDVSSGVFFLDVSKRSGDALQSYTEFSRLMRALVSSGLVVPPQTYFFV